VHQAQLGAELAECVVLRLAVLVDVDLQRDSRPEVAKDQLGAGGVPQVMDLDIAQATACHCSVSVE
jgi:hypothetical protein